MRLTTSMRWALLVLVPLMLIFELGCGKAGSAKTLRSSRLQAPEGGPVVLAAYQPWFGRSGHIDVGYSSQDRTVLQRQIEEAKGLGITAFVVNWYGARHHIRRPELCPDAATCRATRLPRGAHVRRGRQQSRRTRPARSSTICNMPMTVTCRLHCANLQPLLSALSGPSGNFYFSQGKPHQLEQGPLGGRPVARSAATHLQGPQPQVRRRLRRLLCLGFPGQGWMEARRQQLGPGISRTFLRHHEQSVSR